jgi:hypothetical protein
MLRDKPEEVLRRCGAYWRGYRFSGIRLATIYGCKLWGKSEEGGGAGGDSGVGVQSSIMVWNGQGRKFLGTHEGSDVQDSSAPAARVADCLSTARSTGR